MQENELLTRGHTTTVLRWPFSALALAIFYDLRLSRAFPKVRSKRGAIRNRQRSACTQIGTLAHIRARGAI
jgi:hypothetical protein